MKLVSCYISGFGRMVDQSFDFTSGFNQVLENNGWGKTTLTVFLKAMFYGLEYTPRKNTLSDREHYRPWASATYGGTLTIQIGRKTYRIERTFGEKDKEDTFRLIDLATGEDSEDFSSAIGEELFEVDRESYEKSIYVPQGALETVMTTRMNAKLGGLGAVQDDMNRYDQAILAIEEARKRYTSTSKTNPGLLRQLNEEISINREKVARIPELLKAYEAKAMMLMDKRGALRQMEYKKSQLTEQLATLARTEQVVGAYQAKKQSLEKQQETISALDDFFVKGLPEEEELDEWESRERELEVARSRRSALREKQPEPEEEELLHKLFDQHPMTAEVLEEYKEKSEQMKNLRIKGEHVQMTEEDRLELSELKNFFIRRNPTAEELTEQLDYVSRQNVLSGQMKTLEEQYLKMKSQVQEKREMQSLESGISTPVILTLMSFALFFCGYLFFAKVSGSTMATALGVACIVAGVGDLAILGISLSHRRNRRRDVKETMGNELQTSGDDLVARKKEYDELKAMNDAFLLDFPQLSEEDSRQAIMSIQRKKDRYDSLLANEEKYNSSNSSNMEELATLQLDLYTALQPYAEVYGMNLYEEANEGELLNNLTEQLSLYQDFQKNNLELHRLSGEIGSETERILGILRSFPIEADRTDLAAGLKEVRQKSLLYRQTAAQIAELQDELAEIHIAEEAENAISLEELQFSQQKLDDEIAAQKKYIADDQKELEERSVSLLECEEAKETLKDQEKKKQAYEEQVHLYEDTKKYLSQAREEFLATYMGPLRSRLSHYLRILYPGSDPAILTDDFELDMSMSVSLHGKSGGGRTRTAEFLSTGYQDLASFASRAALVDVLFRREEPILILDDPFVNFDAQKLACAKRLLEELSRKYQIIYFTCHESRGME
ncbi:Uncharacterized protein YhaN [Lachnospiraceae bacterium KHCPX20]|nr:Uncharacterized protein YhaN [Lachnospiraceae bacterium KHCPX20]